MNDFQFNLIWIALVWLLMETESSRLGRIAVIVVVVGVAAGITLFFKWVGA